MSFGLSKAQIIGHTGRDAEMRFTPNGTAVTNFTVAVNRRPRNSASSEDSETDWFRVVCFGRQAELADQLVRKGLRIYVDGRLQVNRFTGDDGQERTSVEIIASDFVLLTPRGEGPETGRRDSGQGPEEDFDDLPF